MTALATASCSAGEQLAGAYAQWTSAGDEAATQEIIPDFSANAVTARGSKTTAALRHSRQPRSACSTEDA